MEYRGMYEQEAYHKGYLEGKASMIDLLKSAPIKSPTYKLSESNSIDVLTQINKSQAKEIEALKRYAQHKEDCGHWTGWPKGCTCDLGELLKEVK